ncbi:hypothetical protein HYS84_03540 [Candidatus Saccharibacteria bacterium]|nr:hypothetical protein [Candidatus Saccharibacteria bacterium]
MLNIERTTGLVCDLEIAQLKQNNPLVSDQELQWRLDLLPEQTPESLIRLKESVKFTLKEELRQTKLLAEREIQPLEDKLIFGTIAHLMIYGQKKSD